MVDVPFWQPQGRDYTSAKDLEGNWNPDFPCKTNHSGSSWSQLTWSPPRYYSHNKYGCCWYYNYLHTWLPLRLHWVFFDGRHCDVVSPIRPSTRSYMYSELRKYLRTSLFATPCYQRYQSVCKPPSSVVTTISVNNGWTRILFRPFLPAGTLLTLRRVPGCSYTYQWPHSSPSHYNYRQLHKAQTGKGVPHASYCLETLAGVQTIQKRNAHIWVRRNRGLHSEI